MLHGVSTKLSRLNDVAGDRRDDRRRAPAADRLPQLPRLRPRRRRPAPDRVPRRPHRVGIGDGGAADAGRRGRHGPRRADGRAVPHRRRGELRDRRADPAGPTQIEESLLAVPLRYGTTVVGVIVVSKLGLDQFDSDDLRLLEVLAGHVSVALVNARLYESQRREAESAKALLELTRELSAVTNLDGVLQQVVRGAARIMGSSRCSIWLPTHDGGLDLPRRRRRRGLHGRSQGRMLPRRPRRALLAARRAVRDLGRGGGAASARALGARRSRAPRTRSRSSRSTRGSRRSRSSRSRPMPVARARAARRDREPGAARDHERRELRDARAHVPLDRRGARERARGQGLVHVVARALDLRHGDRGGPRARPRRACS